MIYLCINCRMLLTGVWSARNNGIKSFRRIIWTGLNMRETILLQRQELLFTVGINLQKNIMVVFLPEMLLVTWFTGTFFHVVTQPLSLLQNVETRNKPKNLWHRQICGFVQ